MMWAANNAGSDVQLPDLLEDAADAVDARRHRRRQRGPARDERVREGLGFKHPSPWDYIFFMNKALGKDLGWFWYYWLWTTESVDGSIAGVTTAGGKTTVTVRQDGQMPSPVVLKVQFADSGPAIKPMANAKMVGRHARRS